MSIRPIQRAADLGTANQKEVELATPRPVRRRASSRTRAERGVRLRLPMKPPAVSFDSEIIISAVLKGRPVVFDSKVMIAQAPEKGSALAKAGVVLFTQMELVDGRLEAKRLKWMTLSALAFAIDAGRAHLALDEQLSGGRA